MARRGQFGRLPRAAPDLTNTLVALIREANAQTDANYVDAWKNGGKVEGHGVDDKDLLEHFRKRRDSLSPDDPLWDEWNNRVAQYDFSINESKMSLKFDQGKVKEGEVSNFYKKWANRPEIQQDSEFYRHLLSQQAKWHAAAKAGAARGSAQSDYERHQKWVNNVMKTQINGATYANQYILDMAIAYNAAPEGAKSLEDVYENSSGWHRVLDIIDNGKSDDPFIQGKIDEATKIIREQTGNPDFVFDATHLNGVYDKADHGFDRLKKNARNKTERDSIADLKNKVKFEGARVKATEASARLGDAADNWANALDDCAGNPYCARKVTMDYRAAVMRESKYLVGGQGGISSGMEDKGQAQMVMSTIRTLDDVIAGKPVTSKGASAMTGVAGAGIDATQMDVIGGGGQGRQSDRSPENIIGGLGNMFNESIGKLDKGGWVSNDPQFNRDGSPMTDGAGDPIYRFTVHPPDELPPPGMIEVKGITQFVDPARPSASTPGSTPGPHTVMPRQWVRAEPPGVITLTEGGDPFDPKNAVGTLGGKAPVVGQTTTPLGYMVVRVIGPDGNLQTLYRTGDGSAGSPHLLHLQPPTVPESAGGPKLAKDPRTGVMTPVFTVKPGLDAQNKPIMTYDTTPLADGIREARTENPKSGYFPLGTYQTYGAAATAQAVNNVFAKGGANAAAEANKLFVTYRAQIDALPLNDPERGKAQKDIFQLGKNVALQASGGKPGVLDNEYGRLIDRTPEQVGYERDLAAKGFTAQNYGQDEVDRRVGLLENINDAEARLNAKAAETGGRGMYGYLGEKQLGRDLDAIARAKGDIFNPAISVSGIKIPGVPTQFQSPGGPAWGQQPYTDPLTGRILAPQAGPTTPASPFPAANRTPLSPSVGNFVPPPSSGIRPPTALGPGTPGPTTAMPLPPSPIAPLTPPNSRMAPTPRPTTFAQPPPPTLAGYTQQTDRYGNIVYIGTGANAGKKVMY